MEMTAKLWSPGAGSGGDWRSAALARAPQILTFVLALAVAAQLALIVVGLTSRTRQAAPAATPIVSAPPLDIGTLVNSHLFGNAAVQASGDAANAPATSMPLVLAGLLATEDPKEGMAIIGESAQAAKVIAVGQQVPGGAQLHSVYNDRAIIDRAGALESLYLPRRTGGPTPMAAAAPPPPAGAESNEAMVERMRRLVSEDPGLIGQVMRPQPVFAGGKMRGFRVYPGSNRQAFARMGLRPGDLVTAINGTPLDDKDRAQEIFNTLGSSTDARVTVTRNGRQQDLVLNIAQIANEAAQMGSGADGNIPMEQGSVDQGAASPNPGNE
jgi:general secretion pathway protein C